MRFGYNFKYNVILLSISILMLGACKERPVKSKTDGKQHIDYTAKVYPLLDTENSRWFYFSSASRPFGMVNLSPDTQ
ncbi:MAG: hypothetical protein ABJJ07_06175, partial [Maribacter dokdonensis]